jgi:hypothetical protein
MLLIGMQDHQSGYMNRDRLENELTGCGLGNLGSIPRNS